MCKSTQKWRACRPSILGVVILVLDVVTLCLDTWGPLSEAARLLSRATDREKQKRLLFLATSGAGSMGPYSEMFFLVVLQDSISRSHTTGSWFGSQTIAGTSEQFSCGTSGQGMDRHHRGHTHILLKLYLQVSYVMILVWLFRPI